MQQFGLDAADAVHYGDTIIWLANEGFIRYESHSGNSNFYGLTLTGKGLLALNSKPDVLKDPSTTLGQKINKAAKEGSKEVLTGLINTFIESAVTGFMKSQG